MPRKTIAELISSIQKQEVLELPNCASLEPVVSVVVPTFNHEEYIEAALVSILQQAAPVAMEILVGEDGSTDRTREICERIARANEDRVRLFLHSPSNKIRIDGAATGRFNFLYLLSKTRGQFVAWCDGDDFWIERAKLGSQLDALAGRPDAVIAITNARRAYGATITDELMIPAARFRDLSPREIAAGELIVNQGALFRNVLSRARFPESILEVVNADTLFWGCLAQFGGAVAVPGNTPVVHRVHPGGIWSAKSETDRARKRRATLIAMSAIADDPWVLRKLEQRITAEAAKGVVASISGREWETLALFAREFFRGTLRRPSAIAFILTEALLATRYGRKGARPRRGTSRREVGERK